MIPAHLLYASTWRTSGSSIGESPILHTSDGFWVARPFKDACKGSGSERGQRRVENFGQRVPLGKTSFSEAPTS